MSTERRENKLYCPICGNDQFSSIDEELEDLSDAPDDIRLKCADCQAEFSKSELIEANQDVINANMEEMVEEVIKDFEKRIKKALH